MKFLLICAAVAVATLAGCADIQTEVRASGASIGTGKLDDKLDDKLDHKPDHQQANELAGEHTYALVRAPTQDAGPGEVRYEALVRDKFAQYAFIETTASSAHYLVSLAFDTRPAAVGVAAASDADPVTSAGASNSSGYRHTLTLRFFDRTSNREIYKVTAISHDSHADSLQAVPYLAESALARLPYVSSVSSVPSGGDGAWRVKLHKIDAGAANAIPAVVKIEPR